MYRFIKTSTLLILFLIINGCNQINNTQSDQMYFDQYGKEYNINYNSENAVFVLFKADREIGTEGVKWTRKLRKSLSENVNLYPVLEFKNAYPYLPLFIAKHIAKNHLTGEFYNPNIKDIEEGELHPAMILDWNNSIANNLNRNEDDVWILKYENGNLLKMETGEYSDLKLNNFLKSQ